MKHKAQDKMWAGTEASLEVLLHAEAQIEARLAAALPGQEDEDESPRLLDVQGEVGVVSIKGPMRRAATPFDKLFGITSYEDIREALVAAATKPEVKRIVLDIDSGGGSVNGVADTAALIHTIHTSVKPVTAFTDGAMASAAYWLGSSAGEIFVSKTALVGSIGVIATHMEYSKAMKDSGVTATVMRSGKFKALVNPFEPLTDDAKAQLQAQLDTLYGLFVGHVAEARGKSTDHVDEFMGQGREFMGEAAVAVGLVDGIESFDGVLSKGVSKNSIDSIKKFNDNLTRGYQRADMAKKTALTEQTIAALAEGGVSLEAGDVADQAAEAAAAAQAAEAAAAEEAAAQAAAEAAAGAVAGVVAPAAPSADVVAFLQTQVKEKDQSILSLSMEVKALKDQAAEMSASHTGLLDIAKTSVGRMLVALGGAALEFSGMSATSVLAEHQKVSEQFKTKFKVGGVAAVDATEPVKKGMPASNSAQRARIAATRTH